MDTPLSTQHRRHLQRKKWRLPVLAALLLSGAAWGMYSWARPHVALSELRISTITRADIANTINAAGLVIPAHEEQVVSGIVSRVVRLHAKPGQTVNAGDLLLELDDHSLQTTVHGLREQIAQQDNQINSLLIQRDQARKKLQSEIELLDLDLRAAINQLERLQKLGSLGATSAKDLAAAELAVEKFRVQLQQTREAVDDTQRATAAQIEGAKLQKSILQRQLAQQEQLQAETRVRAPISGSLTYLPPAEGASVASGQMIAKVSALKNFRVEVTLSDFYVQQLQTGQAVDVEIGSETLRGELQTILPEIQNGSIKALVDLQQPEHPALRNKLRVEARIITQQKTSALRIENGPAIKGSGAQDMFLIRDGHAEKRALQIGISDGRYSEVLSGAEEGDQFITSDVSRIRHLNEVQLR